MRFEDEPSAPFPKRGRFPEHFHPDKYRESCKTMPVLPVSSFSNFAEDDELDAFLRLTERLNELSVLLRNTRNRLYYVRNERNKLRDRWKKRKKKYGPASIT